MLSFLTGIEPASAITAAVCALLQASADHVARRRPFDVCEPIAESGCVGICRLHPVNGVQITQFWVPLT